MSAQLYPGARWLPVVNHGGPMASHRGLVLHVQQGTGSLHGLFDTPGASKSSHWWVSKAGAVEQYVDAELEAWAQAAGNVDWCSVETEGFQDQPLTGPQLDALAKLYVWGHQVYRWPLIEANSPSGVGFGVHYMGGVAWSPQHHTCPGPIRAAQRPDVLARAAALIHPTQEAPAVESFMYLVKGAAHAVLVFGNPTRQSELDPTTANALSKGGHVPYLPATTRQAAAWAKLYGPVEQLVG